MTLARTTTLLCCLTLFASCGGGEAGPSTADGSGDGAALDGGAGDGTGGDAVPAGDAASDAAGDTGGDSGRAGDTSAPSDTGPGLVCPGQPGCPCEASDECDDGDPCTIDGPCDGGACQGKSPKSCDDGEGCTHDTCEAGVGCVHKPFQGPCEDGDPCTVGDTCKGGSCTTGKPTPCDDGNVCTDDSCTKGIGCTFSHNTAECVAENQCADAGVCSFASCKPGKLKPCSDKLPCTYSVCDPQTGCDHVPLPKEPTCTDGAIVDGRCYLAFGESKGLSWLDARASCKAWGGELATLHSKQANAAARAQADAVCGKGKVTWIGLNDRMREGVRRWGDSSTIDYQNWNKGEPNNSGDEDVTSMLADGRWNDVSDDPKKATAPCWVCSRRLPTPCKPGGSACTEGATCADAACDKATAKPLTCDDHNACTSDACSKGSCAFAPLPKGATCTLGACAGSVCISDAKPPAKPPASCKAALAADPDATSGVYWLQPAGLSAPVSAHCDMGAAGGGWTLVLKTRGKNKDFAWAGKHWSSKPTAPVANPGPEAGEAILPTWWTVPLSEVRVIMVRKKVTRSVVLPAKGASLRALIATDKSVVTNIGLPQWKQLLVDASLQRSCHDEGINVGLDAKKPLIRIGIRGNNENDCGTPDSWIGVGGKDSICGGKKGVFSGNLACYSADKGNRTVAADTWVYVR